MDQVRPRIFISLNFALSSWNVCVSITRKVSWYGNRIILDELSCQSDIQPVQRISLGEFIFKYIFFFQSPFYRGQPASYSMTTPLTYLLLPCLIQMKLPSLNRKTLSISHIVNSVSSIACVFQFWILKHVRKNEVSLKNVADLYPISYTCQ